MMDRVTAEDREQGPGDRDPSREEDDLGA